MSMIRENRATLLVIITSFIFFAAVIILGGRFVFEKELDTRHAQVNSEVLHAENVVREFLSGRQRDLFLLLKLAGLDNYADSGFRAGGGREKALDTFSSYLKLYRFVSRISIIDALGSEIVSSGNSAGASGASGPDSDCFEKAMRLSRGQAHAAIPTTASGLAPVCSIAAPLFNSKEEVKGVLLMDINLSELFGFLPEGIFLVDEQGQTLSRTGEGLSFSRVDYKLGGTRGELRMPDENSVHYSTVTFSPGNKWAVALNDDHNTAKLLLLKLVFSSLVIFTLYFGLTLFIGYSHIRNHSELEATQKAIIFSLSNLAEQRDPETGYHLERTRNYGVILAKELAKTKKYGGVITLGFLEDLYNAAPLHDMGKVGIRDSVLLKEGKLTDEEFSDMKRHVSIGRNILDDTIGRLGTKKQFLIMSRNIAAYHHEKFDGSGYLESLEDGEIPLEARIYALCDAYDAIRAKRPYKEPLPHEEAVRRITVSRGSHFDPDVVDAFLRSNREFMEVYETYRFFVEKHASVPDYLDHKKMRVEWTQDLSVGVEEIDAQHRELITRINGLLEAIARGKGKEEVSRTIAFLEDYIIMHFSAEEAYMQRSGYDLYEQHLALHSWFKERFYAIKKDHEEHGASSRTVIELNRHVVEWLINHISRDDRALGKYLSKKAS